jgi:hypothetical protein
MLYASGVWERQNMASRRAFVLCALACLATTGCTSSTAFEPQTAIRSSGTSRITFIRPSTIVSAGQPVRVVVNDKEVGSLGIGTYLHVDRPAGAYRIAIDHPLDFGKTELATTITADKDYYFQIFPAGARVATAGAYGAAVSHKLGIAGIGDAEAKALMQDMKR